jgi:hypothetical protein
MEELLDTLEPMCDGELVHEFGATLEEDVERQDIYEHHKEAQVALVTTKAAAAAAAAAVVSAGGAVGDDHDDAGGQGDGATTDPVDGSAFPYDVLAHFHGY